MFLLNTLRNFDINKLISSMYKKKILDLLIAAYPGVSSTILGRIADKLAKTVTKEEEVQPAVDGVTIQTIIDAEGDRRATDATQTAVTNYEKKHSLKEGKPVSGDAGKEKDPATPPAGGEGADPAKGGDLAAQIAAAIKSAVEPLTTEIASLKAEKAADSFNSQLNAAIAGASDKFKERVLRDSKFLKFDTPEAQAEWLETIKTEATEDANDNAAQGAAFGIPKTGGKGGKKDEVPASVMAGIKQTAPADDAQLF